MNSIRAHRLCSLGEPSPEPRGEHRPTMEQMPDSTVMRGVCRQNDDGSGPIICWKDCPSYDNPCRYGPEFFRRGLDEKAPEPKKSGPKRRRKRLTASELRLIDLLRQVRENEGMNRKEFAETFGLSRSSVDVWEAYKGLPSLGMLMDILDRLGWKIVIEKEGDGKALEEKDEALE